MFDYLTVTLIEDAMQRAAVVREVNEMFAPLFQKTDHLQHLLGEVKETMAKIPTTPECLVQLKQVKRDVGTLADSVKCDPTLRELPI